jgi:hypothetical protein
VLAGFLGVVLAAFLLRLMFLNSGLDRDWPFSIFFFGDSAHYHELAVHWLGGKLYDHGIPYHPPGFTWFLGLLYEWLGVADKTTYPYKLCLAWLNAITVGGCWLWWRKLLGAGWSLVAALFAASSFGWLILSATYNSEVLCLPFLLLTLWIAWQGRRGLSGKAAAGLGLVMALGSLVRAEHLWLWPFLLVYFFALRERKIPLKRHARNWLIGATASALALLPNTLGNASNLHQYNLTTPALEPLPEWVSVTAYGPLNFAMANYDEADGGFTPKLINAAGLNGQLDYKNPAQRRLFIHGYGIGLRWLRDHPGPALQLAEKKLVRWSDGLRYGWGISDRPAGLAGTRQRVDMITPERRWLVWPQLALLLCGMALSFLPAWREYSLCTLVVMHRLLITLAFFGYARGLVVILPALIPLLLLPLVALTDRKFPGIRPRLKYLSAALLLLLLLEGLIVCGRDPRNYIASGNTDSADGNLIQDDVVTLRPKF